MLNLMCGASNERVATVYPASAMANASVVDPRPRESRERPGCLGADDGGQVVQRKAAKCLAASGRSIANQYTVRNASMHVRACPG